MDRGGSRERGDRRSLAGAAGSPETAPAGPAALPSFALAKGRVQLLGPEGWTTARWSDDELPEVFGVTEAVGRAFGGFLLVDLDGVGRNRPQLDYLQELSRDGRVWVDAGVRTAEESIDIVVTGAYRTILTNSRLRNLQELRRAWKMSSDLAFEVTVDLGPTGGVGPGAAWFEDVGGAREVGPIEVILDFGASAVDWSIVRSVAAGGPTWVRGRAEAADPSRLAFAQAAGGIFPLGDWLREHELEIRAGGEERGRDDESRTS